LDALNKWTEGVKKAEKNPEETGLSYLRDTCKRLYTR
jgi:hypothetical protein